MSGIEQVTWNITCTDTFKSKLLSLRAEILGYLFGGKKKKIKKKNRLQPDIVGTTFHGSLVHGEKEEKKTGALA